MDQRQFEHKYYQHDHNLKGQKAHLQFQLVADWKVNQQQKK